MDSDSSDSSDAASAPEDFTNYCRCKVCDDCQLQPIQFHLKTSKDDVRCEDCLQTGTKRKLRLKGSKRYLMMCVSCKGLYCAGLSIIGHEPKGHAESHSLTTGHPISVWMDDPHTCYCFLCQRSQRVSLVSLPLASNPYIVRGIQNLGNTRYVNALLQCLLALSEMRLLMLGLNAPSFTNGALGRALQNLFIITAIDSDARRKLNLKRLLRNIRKLNARYEYHTEQDCQELLIDLLDDLSKAEKQGRDNNNTSVDFIFKGELSVTLTCRYCGDTLSKPESFYKLSLMIPPYDHPTESDAFSLTQLPKKRSIKSFALPKRSRRRSNAEGLFRQSCKEEIQKTVPLSSIRTCLEYYFRKEVIVRRCEGCMKHNTIQSKDDVVISINESTRDLTEPAHQRKVKVKGNHLSSHCKKKGSKKQFKRRNTAHQVGEGKIKQKDIERPTDKTLFLSREPPVLTLHMMRFEGIDKKTGHVEFDEILDIQAFMDPRSENNATRYHLVAVVEHIGGSIEQGQYIAYVRGSRMMYEQEPIPSSSSSWFFASDDTIRQASLDEVLKCKAYILFYERTKVYAMGKEEEKGVRTAETGNSLCTALRLEPTDSGCRDMTLHSQQEGYNVGGIPNLGFTCYINALVQCLLALDELWMLILGPHALVGSLGLELRNLFWKTRMGNDAEAMLKPQRLLECIRALNGRYRTPYQQDCHELLLDLLNWLNLEDMQKRPPDVGKDVPTVIDSIFQGQVSITWRYKCCQHTADKTETFYVLSLALPPGEHPTESGAFSLPLPPKECSTKSVASPQRSGKRAKTEFKGLSQWIWEDEKQKAVPISSIEKCLKYFFRNEVVAKRCDTCEPSPIRRKDGQTVANTNKSMPVDRGETGHDHRRKAVEKSNYRHSVVCEQIINTVNLDTTKQAELENTAHQVGEGQPTDKALFLTKLPPVSTLHVLRFENIYKKAGHVEFEESLNVETYLGPRSEKKDNSKYRLVGVIEHIGSSMEEGHYIAYVRGSCDHEKSSSSSWFCADDDSVRQASIDEVLKCEAYILFYERTKDTSLNKRKSSSSQQNGDGDSRLAKIMRYLPEDIWHHVHSQMPLNDAARAACLSSIFLRSWRCRPNLTLSMGTLASETHNCKSIYSDVIDSILRNHSGCVKMLKFDLKDLSCHSLDRWLRAAVEPGIEKLTVQPWQESYIFPLSLLPEGVRNSIRSLKIGFCTFHPTSQPSPMRSLTSLHLHTTNITGDELECLLYNSLVLERLVLIDCKDIVYLKISCKLRQLVYLKIVGCRLKVIESKAPKLLNFWLCSRTIP